MLFERVEHQSGLRERPTTPAPDETKAEQRPAAGLHTRSEPTPRRWLSKIRATKTERGGEPALEGERPGGATSWTRAQYEEMKQAYWSDVPERGDEPALEAERPGRAT